MAMQAVWDSVVPNADEHMAPKRQRLFIARQACENCRHKKTRCDGGSPCGLCRSAGIDCRYAERKATKNEVSLGMIFNTLQRIESKIEGQQQLQLQLPLPPRDYESDGRPSSERVRQPSSVATTDLASPGTSHESPTTRPTGGIHALLATTVSTSQMADIQEAPRAAPSICSRPSRHIPVIQYPIRQLTSWPAVRVLLQEAAAKTGSNEFAYDAAAATMLEQRRPPLPLPSLSHNASSNWLAGLHVSIVKDLSDKYFATFNLGNPILDRRLFRQHSLGIAVHSEFGVNMESCVVLVTMALGTLGHKALVHTGFERGATYDDDGTWDDGLVFFNEARKRIGLLGCDNSLQACQFYLLSGLFYSQLLRPVDFWASVSRASMCCTSFWACLPNDCDDWTLDMQARLFWITAMFEAVLTQELDLPVSNLLQYEDRIPLPRFVEFPSVASVVSSSVGITAAHSTDSACEAEQDAFCHYHFLSQIAHRIILTRLCDSLFANRSCALASRALSTDTATTMTRNDYPPQALEDELLHQLEQWRSQLPDDLRWKESLNESACQNTPADVLVVPWLRARYYIARYHLRRPLLHRALHHPDWMTPDDFDKCCDALTCAVDWMTVIQPTLLAMDCFPLKFFVCTQLFGQLLLLHALAVSPMPELRQLIPHNYAAWRILAFQVLEKCAPHSPAIAREYKIVAAVHEIGNKASTPG